jgi:hypothetical protein
MIPPIPDLPNFAEWSNKNLADFAVEAYIRLQEQQEIIQDQSLKLLLWKQLTEPTTHD